MARNEYRYEIDKEREVAQFLGNEEARIAKEYRRNFWFRKTSCWEITHCPDSIKNACPAPKHPSLPCWQIEGTYCKLDERNESGEDTSTCKLCRVYEQYGGRRLLQIKLFTSAIHHSGLGRFPLLPLSGLRYPVTGQLPASSAEHSLSPGSWALRALNA